MSRWNELQNKTVETNQEVKQEGGHKIKILVVDDDSEIHRVTNMILTNYQFEGKGIEILHAYSGEETLEILHDHQDIQMMFLDVVMENKTSGLDIIKTIREEMALRLLRIVLRTGQPGQAPEESVIHEYDINDYHLKTDITSRRLKTTLTASLKNYRDLITIEKHRQGLEKIIEASGRLFRHNQLGDFLESIMQELSNFQKDNPDLMFIKEENDGFMTITEQSQNKIVAATGKYKKYIGTSIEEIDELKDVKFTISKMVPNSNRIYRLDTGILVQSIGKSETKNFIYIGGSHENYDYDLLRLFMNNFSIALDNFILNNMLNTTQREIIIALAETVESHFEETGSHIRRIASMMYKFALHLDFSYKECEVIKLASTMHDLGKIAIPDSVLKKPGRLTDDEFEIMKQHAAYGHKILSKSGLDIMSTAAEIALHHHEKYDGSGYPSGLKGKEISLPGRMMAIVDVYDAMTHKRVYKDAMTVEETLGYINSAKNQHFDANLVEIFINNISDITEEAEAL